jgi:hypothetical protein
MEKALSHSRRTMVEKYKNNDIHNKGQETTKFKNHKCMQTCATYKISQLETH